MSRSPEIVTPPVPHETLAELRTFLSERRLESEWETIRIYLAILYSQPEQLSGEIDYLYMQLIHAFLIGLSREKRIEFITAFRNSEKKLINPWKVQKPPFIGSIFGLSSTGFDLHQRKN